MLHTDNAIEYKPTLIKINPKHQYSSERNASAFFIRGGTQLTVEIVKSTSAIYHSFPFPRFPNKCNCVLPNSEWGSKRHSRPGWPILHANPHCFFCLFFYTQMSQIRQHVNCVHQNCCCAQTRIFIMYHFSYFPHPDLQNHQGNPQNKRGRGGNAQF